MRGVLQFDAAVLGLLVVLIANPLGLCARHRDLSSQVVEVVEACIDVTLLIALDNVYMHV